MQVTCSWAHGKWVCAKFLNFEGGKKKKSGLEEFPAVVNDLLNLNLSESL